MERAKKKLIFIVGMSIAVIAMIVAVITFNFRTTEMEKNEIDDPELARAMNYDRVQEGDSATDSEYVEFDAFFLRDLDGDGYAEGVRGTCREIGKTDTLYMELNVVKDGYLRDGLITINGKNFYLVTSIPKDGQIAENAISDNTTSIKLNDITSGTEKLLTGTVKAGYSSSYYKAGAIGSDSTGYSKTNTIVLTGTHVASDGTETAIEKVINFDVDWYGTATASIPYYAYRDTKNLSQTKEINDTFDVENNEITLEFDIYTAEIQYELNLKKSVLYGTVPQMVEIDPKRVEITGTNVTYTYDPDTREYSAQIEAETDVDGKIVKNAYIDTYYSSRYAKFHISITYPLDAFYAMSCEAFEYRLPVNAYFECYNNENIEFDNPYITTTASNVAIVVFENIVPPGKVGNFNVSIGDYVYYPSYRYLISKLKPMKIFNGISESESNDTYKVNWYAYTGSEGNIAGLTMKEGIENNAKVYDSVIDTSGNYISMMDFTKYISIGFSNLETILGEDGWLKVYDDESDELIVTFDKSNWNSYSSIKQYKYETPIRSVRIETSVTNVNSSLTIYHTKEIDDNYIIDNYTKDEFDTFRYVRTRLEGYVNGSLLKTATAAANYEASLSVAKVSVSKNAITTQETEEEQIITITTECNNTSNESYWKNGSFLIKLPNEIIAASINNVTCSNADVQIKNYEIFEEDENYYIRVNTTNDVATAYSIYINLKMTPDPRISTVSRTIEMYAINRENENYYYNSADIYDIDGDGNKTEFVNKYTSSILLVSPNALLTNQTAYDYDENGSTVIAPQIAYVEKEQRNASINIQIRNNYSNTISDIAILGKIPFEKNEYVISESDLGSTYTTVMTDDGITVPDDIKDVCKIYYSYEEKPTRDLDNQSNGWTETPDDFGQVKSYLIILENYTMAKDEIKNFCYTVRVPEGVDYNEVSYSHYGVYFSLDTETGKYRTRTEPNKLGLMIAREFDIELVKYQTDKNKTVQGAGYSIQEDGSDEANTRFTDENGKIVFKGVLLDRTYTITETSSPAEYELSDMTFTFRTYEEDGQIVIEKLDGDIKSFEVVKNDGEDAKVVMTTEDDVKANLKITKSELDSEIKLKNGRYKLTGKNYESGVTIITDSNGVATLNGLTLGEEYILEEVKAPKGYYLNTEAIKFVVTNVDGEFVLNRIEGVVKAESIIVEDEIPCVNFEIEDEKIPTYNLLINKVAKGETTPLPGVKFRLYYGKDFLGTYESDDNGQIQLNGLYRYVEEKNVEQIYTLKEIYAPEGYAKIKDIEFYVEEVEGSLVLNTEATSVPEQSADGDNVTITVEDAKSFKLTKVDGETAEVLPGTKFAIYNIDGNKAIPATDSKGNLLGILEEIDGKEYYVVETNENGEITADLPEGLYKAVEVQASDDKYDISKISDRTYYFGIGASRKCSEAESEGLVEYAQVQPHISLGDDTDFPLKVLENGCCIYGKGSTIVKTNAVGEEEWYKTISFSDIDCVGNKILVATTSGVIYEYLEDGTLSNTRDLECTVSKMEFFTDGSFAILSEGKLMYFSNTFSKIWEKSGTYINLAIRKDDYIAAYGSGYIYMYNLNGTLLWKTAIDISPTTLTIGEDGSVAVVEFTTANGKFRIVGAEGIICSSEIGDGNNEGFFSVVATRDGGYLAVGWARGIAIDGSQTESAQDIILEHGLKGGGADLFLLKYNFEGKIQWGKVFSGDSHHTANQVTIDNSGNYYIIGRGALNIDSEDTVDDDMINTTGTASTGVLIKISGSTSVPEQSEIVAVNNRKEFKITTAIEEIDGMKGGTISGEDERPYETVKYGDSSTKEINIVPDDEYEIISITINGEEYEFETNEDGSYVMPLFDNVIENKNIVVKFAKSSNKLTINKTDEITGEVIPDVTFQIDQLEERADPEVDLTGLTGNSSIYKYPVYDNEVTGKLGDIVANGAEYVTISGDEYESLLGELTNNGTYYFIENVDGTYTPTNSKTYQVANGGFTGIHSVTANSYIQIDLSEKSSDETFAVMVNASCSSEKNCDYGYATITEDTTAPSYSSSSGKFMYISGTVSSENYISGGLQGGKIYYLHLGYMKNGSVDTGTDQVVINSIGVYNATSVSYNFVENDGKYESNNQGANNTTAASYIPIDLSALSGDYTVIVNATVSSESGNDYGYVTVSETTTRTSSNTFIQISGDKTEENYKILEGGKIYYLHFGYMKNSSVNSGDDKFTINSVKVYAGSESKLYNFVEEDGIYKSTNKGMAGTYARSYIPIDLTGYIGKYNLIVNADISSEINNDYGYLIANTSTNQTTSSYFARISGSKTAKDYTTVLTGGKMYYLHMVYYKNSSIDNGDDEFRINSIKLELNESDLYHTTVTTNLSGQAITQIPYGLYKITEIDTPKEYEEIEPIEYRMETGKDNVVNITNKPYGNVTVHHYMVDKSGNNTEIKLVDDEYFSGKDGETYTTLPKADIEGYVLKNVDGEYVLPDNREGNYVSGETIEVNYYYQEASYKLVVHHYIEGTNMPVPLIDGSDAEDVEKEGLAGEPYETEPLSDDELSLEYELTQIPSNATGIYDGRGIVVTYYYKKVERELTLIKYEEDGVTPLEGAKFTINGDEYISDSNGKIKLKLEAGTYDLTEIETPEGYSLPDNPTTQITITRETADDISIVNEKTRGNVIVHHYIDGTTTPVELASGELATDDMYTGIIGDMYATKPHDDLIGYEYVLDTDNTSGEFIDGTIEVIYYYKILEYQYTVNYIDKNSNENITESKVQDGVKYKTIINSTDEVIDIDGYNYNSVDIDTLLVREIEENNVINIYYTKRTDLSYQVNYLEKDTNKVLNSQKIVNNVEFESVINSVDEVITIDGYNYDSVDKDTLTITTGTNEINIYYTKRTDLSYQVNYLEKDTNKVLNPQKIVNNVEFESVINSSGEVIEIDGYNYDFVDKDTLTITTGLNEINIYYTKRTDLSYQVNYLEKDTNKVLNSQKIVNNVEFESVINSSDEVIAIDGYNYDSVDKDTLTITTGRNEINIYYTKRTDLSYQVNYLEKDTNKVLNPQKIVNNVEFESVINSADEVITIDGYNYDSVDKDILIITTGTNEINIYYTKRTDLSYQVNYLEKDTNKVLNPQKIVNNVEFETEITSLDEVITIDGYRYDSVDKDTLTITTGLNEINIYYTKRSDLSYTVKYLEKGTNKVLKDSKLVENMTLEDEVISSDEIIEIYGYNYDSVDKDILIIGAGLNEINIYYTKKDTKVTVHYYEEGTTNKVSEDVEISGKVFDSYTTTEATDIPSKYELIAVPQNSTGEMTEEEIVVTYYYRKKATQVIVHYYEEGTTNKLSENVVIDGRVDDLYTTESATDVPIKYELVADPENKVGTMTEEVIEVTYYYRVKDAILNIRYLEKGTDIVLAEPEQQIGKVDENYITTEKPIEGYTLVEDSGNTTGILTVDPITVTFYYLYNTKATVQYIDKITGEILDERTEEGLEGDEFATDSKDFENYILVEEPAQKTVNMTKEEIVLKYYYIHISGGVIEKHIDVISGEILANDVHTGNEGDLYDIPSRTFEGYDLVEDTLPENSQGTMEINPIEVIYYYIYKTKVTAKYIDKVTGEELVPSEEQLGHEKDTYTTDRKIIDDYKLESVPNNADGEMTKEEIEVIYYYIHISGGVIVNHYDVKTDKQLIDEVKIEGYEGDKYETYEEDIDGYDLIEEIYPENASGNMTIETIRVNYYYIKKSGVIIKYIDKETGEEIIESDIIDGHEDDEYTTVDADIPGYDLVEEPENKEGTMIDEPIEVVYYYRRPAKVIVRYLEINTDKELAKEERIDGHEGDPYETEEKDIKFYNLVAVPDNANGNMRVIIDDESDDYEYDEDEFNNEISNIIENVTNDVDNNVVLNEISNTITSEVTDTTNTTVMYSDIIDNKISNMVSVTDATEDGEIEPDIDVVNDTIYVTYYYRQKEFNLSVDKMIDRIIVNGMTRNINGKLGKVEINKTNISNTSIQIVYKLVINNEGELNGKATVVENIPDGLTMSETKNPGWIISGNTATIDTEILEPNETVEYTVILDWNGNGENVGSKENIVQIKDLENEAGFEESDDKDNADYADFIVLIGTGIDESESRNDYSVLNIGMAIGLLIIAINIVFELKKKEL